MSNLPTPLGCGNSSDRAQGVRESGEERIDLCHSMIQQTISLLHDHGQPFALMAKEVEMADGRLIPTACRRFFATDYRGIGDFVNSYCTRARVNFISLNPLCDDSGGAPRDEEVSCRCWLLIDVDPVIGGDGCNASDLERTATFGVAERVREFFATKSFPDPIVADSGNGCHLLFPIALPTADGNLVANFLRSIKSEFASPDCSIDPTVSNAARFTKLYGTVARKYPGSPGREQRLSRILTVPDKIVAVSEEQLRAIEKHCSRHSIPTNCPASPPNHAATIVAGDELVTRARKYLAKIEPAISGKHGHDATFRAACKIGPGFDLPMETAMGLLSEWNARCQPPWSAEELRHKIDDAYRTEKRRGWLLAKRSAANSACQQLPALPGASFPVLVPDFIPSHCSDSLSTLRDSDRQSSSVARSHRTKHWISLWQLYSARQSRFTLPDAMLRAIRWGAHRCPRNWRTQLIRIFGDTEKTSVQVLQSALKADRAEAHRYSRYLATRSETQSWVYHKEWEAKVEQLTLRIQKFECRIKYLKSLPCPEHCSLNGSTQRHRHHSFAFPRNELGWLERFISSEAKGVFTVDFDAVDASNQKILNASIRERIAHWAYLPVELFGRSRAVNLSDRQIRLLQGIVRETTRKLSRGVRYGEDQMHRVVNGMVIGRTSTARIRCPALDADLRYAQFCGNLGDHRGRGYAIVGRNYKGWLHRAGYGISEQTPDSEQLAMQGKFLRDLSSLSEKFGLVCVALLKDGTSWRTLPELMAMHRNAAGRRQLKTCRLRIYTIDDYLARWRHWFASRLGFSYIPGGEWDVPAELSTDGHSITSSDDLRRFLTENRLLQKDFGEALGWTESRVSHLLSGRRKWSASVQNLVDGFVRKIENRS